MSFPRLLVVCQAVDTRDPVLGFFHTWLREFASRAGRVHVVCLKEGAHSLPQNVTVHSLGKESGASRMRYVVNFYVHLARLRGEYDAVFVHMNQEYVLLAGLLWLLTGKRVVLWRNHKKGGVLTRIASLLAHSVCYTSASAYVAGYGNAHRMPLGVDTELFKPSEKEPKSILFLGRMDEVKNADVFIEALAILRGRGIQFHADLYGEPTNPSSAYAKNIRKRAEPLVHAGVLSLHGSVTHEAAAGLFAKHAVYVNLTPSGSFDKTIGEAMAAGCIVVAANDAVQSELPEGCFVETLDAQGVADSLVRAIDNNPRVIGEKARAFVEAHHSIMQLMDELPALFRDDSTIQRV